ncbi:MAG: hypothetical protein AAFZ07_23380 [Actinomycetota bacterium]
MSLATFGSILARLLLADAPAAQSAGKKVQISSLEIARSTVYFGFLEGSAFVGDSTLHNYYRRDDLMTAQRLLRQAVLDNWLGGGAPMTAVQLVDRAKRIVGGDTGTALLISHNVLKAMARASDELPWSRASAAPQDKRDAGPLKPVGAAMPIASSDYFDGQTFYRSTKLHPAGVVKTTGSDPSIWGLIFDSKEFPGPDQAGDMYHYFLMATASYYASRSRLIDLEEPRLPLRDRGKEAWALMRPFINGIASVESPSKGLDLIPPALLAWAWCNAMSFAEGTVFGVTLENNENPRRARPDEQADVDRESIVHRKGAVLGLRLAVDPQPLSSVAGFDHWPWFVPIAGEMRYLRDTADLEAGLLLLQVHDAGPRARNGALLSHVLANPDGRRIPK